MNYKEIEKIAVKSYKKLIIDEQRWSFQKEKLKFNLERNQIMIGRTKRKQIIKRI